MHHFVIHGNHVHHNDTGSQEALRVMEDTHDFKITNNEVNHNSNIGIVVVGWSQYGKPHDGLVSGNRAHHNSLSAPWSAGIYLDSPRNIIVEYNISWENARGFEMGCKPLPVKVPLSCKTANWPFTVGGLDLHLAIPPHERSICQVVHHVGRLRRCHNVP